MSMGSEPGVIQEKGVIRLFEDGLADLRSSELYNLMTYDQERITPKWQNRELITTVF